MPVQLTVCGPRGSFPAYGEQYLEFGNDTSCYCLRDGENGLILDCGSGLGKAAEVLKDCRAVDVLLSHVHYDHIMGLFENRDFFRNREVTFYGGFAVWRKAETENTDGKVLFPIDSLIPGLVKNAEHGVSYSLRSGFQVRFSSSNHGDGTQMIEVSKDKLRICYTGDYEHDSGYSLDKLVAGCDLLLFDGSYTPNDYPKYKGWGHSSWEEGVNIAIAAKVKKLLITHHAPQYNDELLLREEQKARLFFTDVDFARQNSVYEL